MPEDPFGYGLPADGELPEDTPPDKGARERFSAKLIIAIVVAVFVVLAGAIGTVLLFGSSGNTVHQAASSGPPGGVPAGRCRVPAGASAGTQTPPSVVTRAALRIGAPDVEFTKSSGSVTVYVYCYNSVDGGQLGAASMVLNAAGYDKVPGQNPTTQVVFQKQGKVPYGIALTVTGTLNATTPGSGDHGGLSLTWVDQDPGN